MTASASDIERTTRDLLARRRDGATICPSEVARALGGEGWRDLMEPVRGVAADLADRGEVVVTQGGETVDVRTAKGPVRIGLPQG
ncbi:DUF3253 domain-containing protein [Nocardioides zeae]|uniref:DUF3253 domain-containing protein n=1 Tax=Nocardioides imazamoxiresistens TaxID=3231893 RepID=A0ABU3PY76_9ACTN|nr:DUF3253 domain-containing protein [Nocardioides zeae]MDT9594197.1 DUF3253 domain-containing protein [Nocardioides zeae]